MKSLRAIILCGFLLLSFPAHSQSNIDDYLNIIDEMNLEDLRTTMLSVARHGLNPQAYWTIPMEQMFLGSGDPGLLKDLAAKNYLRLLRDISIGSVVPESMGKDVKIRSKIFITPAQLRTLALAQGYQAGGVLENLAPLSAPYLSLKEALRRISEYCQKGEWLPLPILKRELKIGSKNSALVPLKTRMRQLGYNVTSDDVFDTGTLAAVKDIQWLLRRVPDGVISPGGKTWKYLNVSCQERQRQVRLDMQKLRWFPQVFEDRYIFINLAMTYFNLIDKSPDGPLTMSFRTINGRPARKSPTMKDKIVYVIINPFWVVPPTVFKEDKVEEIRNLPPWEINYYFQSHNYEVWNKSFTRRIDPASIDWYRLDPNSDAEFYIRQKPNYYNALGVLKFMMTNQFAIYLHDTNQRELFTDPQRLLSSGCVRLERPLDLAEYLLKGTAWNRAAIEKVAAKPGEVLDKETRVNLKQPIPVYMMFLTSHLSGDGVMRFVEDSYNQGSRLLQLGAW